MRSARPCTSARNGCRARPAARSSRSGAAWPTRRTRRRAWWPANRSRLDPSLATSPRPPSRQPRLPRPRPRTAAPSRRRPSRPRPPPPAARAPADGRPGVLPATPGPSGSSSAGAELPGDAVDEMGDASALDDPWILQCERRVRELVEVADALAEQDGHQVDPHLVEQAGVQALLGDVGPATPTQPSPAVVLACATACSTPSVTKVIGNGASSRGHPCGTSWVTTNTGTP